MSKFAEGEIVRYTKSGRLYIVTGLTGHDSSRIGVYGWKDGRQFGPIRFLDADRLVSVPRQ